MMKDGARAGFGCDAGEKDWVTGCERKLKGLDMSGVRATNCLTRHCRKAFGDERKAGRGEIWLRCGCQTV